MVRIKPFRAVRPPKEHAAEVASRPYDVLNSAEAKSEATERSLLHIIKPQIDFEPIADGAIGQMMEKVVLAPQRPRRTDEELKAECGSWAAQGKPAGRPRNIVTSLELQSEKMEVINKRLQEKYKALEENEVRYEAIECDDADYVIVAFGSSARICSATVEMARAEGLKVGLLRPITLYPFPKKQIAELAARGVKGFLSAELNAGQMVEDVRLAVNGKAPVEHYGRQGGMMFNPDEVLDALKEKLIKK